MSASRQLMWVQRNRRRVGRICRVGALTGELADGLQRDDESLARRAARALSAEVDEQFRRHCRLSGTKRGGLVVMVDQPGLVCAMRWRWLPRISRTLADKCGASGAAEVLFGFGQSGVRIPEPGELPTGSDYE